MSSKFESSIREIPYSQQSVYDMLSDLNNINKVKDRIPEDKLKDLSFDADSIFIKSPMGDVQLHIVERNRNVLNSRRNRVHYISTFGFKYNRSMYLRAK